MGWSIWPWRIQVGFPGGFGSHNILRRSIAEVRKMQTERVAREQAAGYRSQARIEMMQSLAEEMAQIPFCKSTSPVGRISDLSP
jgi:hypothetical protein